MTRIILSENQSKNNGFILQGFSEYPEIQIPLFCVLLLLYLITMLANLTTFIVICMNPVLHVPMYIFICNLSIIDISASSVSQPKLLSILLIGDNTISFYACMTQLHLFLTCVSIEFVLLTAMAYDRYVAICYPLRYLIIMNKRFCAILITSCWIFSFLFPILHIITISNLPFCRSHLIDHFFCDPSVLLKISCETTSLLEMINYIFGSIIDLPAFILIIISYVYIISSILKIHSAEGRKKAFSTCSSHLIVVIMFYGTILITYIRPSSQYSSAQSKPMAFLYTSIIPSVNPFIYTFRNQDVKKYLSRKQPTAS